MNQIRKAFSVLPNCKVELPQHFLQQMTFCRGPPVQAPRHLQVRVLPEFRPMSSCCLSRAGERLNPPSSGSCPGTAGSEIRQFEEFKNLSFIVPTAMSATFPPQCSCDSLHQARPQHRHAQNTSVGTFPESIPN